MVETLTGIETVKALALETLMIRRHERLLARSATHSSDIAYLGAMTRASAPSAQRMRVWPASAPSTSSTAR
ncbi:MAG: hypothetical protein R3F55_21760 [Alphaproteobacteria bacterium]